jgi:hypothetical protein
MLLLSLVVLLLLLLPDLCLSLAQVVSLLGGYHRGRGGLDQVCSFMTVPRGLLFVGGHGAGCCFVLVVVDG